MQPVIASDDVVVCCDVVPLYDSNYCSLFGFLLGTSLTGAGVYSYVLTEYKASNDQLTDDIYVSFCRQPCPIKALHVITNTPRPCKERRSS